MPIECSTVSADNFVRERTVVVTTMTATPAFQLFLDKFKGLCRYNDLGANAPITAQQLCARAGVSIKTFEQNFGGGVTCFLSISEHVVADRFKEAVESVNGSLSDKLTVGLRSLYFVNKWSKYNTTDKPAINMNLRTRFCVKTFGDGYWMAVVRPLFPEVDAFAMKNELYNGYVPDEAKDYPIFCSSRLSGGWSI